MDDEGEVLISEAARELNVSHVTVWRHIKAGKLTARRVGPLYLIPKKALNEFKARERPPGRPRKTVNYDPPGDHRGGHVMRNRAAETPAPYDPDPT